MDRADRLRLYSLVEDPERWEAMIRREAELGRTDPTVRAVIESIYCDEDRAAAFERFREGLEFTRTLRLFSHFNVGKDMRICEIGAGSGYLAWALYREGFVNLEIVEPNSGFVSGTGYFRSREDARGIRIWNDLDSFYNDGGRYDLVLTHNCAHHFRGLAYVASCIRQKMRESSRWLMIREPHVDSAEELYEFLETHPHSQKYGLYEFAIPAAHYVEAVELAGFELAAVVPRGYANGALETYVLQEGGRRSRLTTWVLDEVLRRQPALTVRMYQGELFANRYLRGRRRVFTRPQAMLFHRRGLR